MPRPASHFVSWPRLDTRGVCPTSCRQWADFLVSLMAPLRRHYKTARTETRRHLLLKIRQMPTQIIGFARLCFAQRCPRTRTKVLKLSAGLRTHSVECSKLGKTRIIEDARRGVVRNTGFCGQNCRRLFYPELSGIGFSEYPLSPSFSVTAGDYGDVPDRTPRLPDALHCAWRAACRRSCGRARALHRPLR